jgi:AraC family transcriptional regulator of adaptative response/methylated-DNA-[protein]-cysteine methyltransferase
METQQNIDYKRIEKAIALIQSTYTHNPSLDQLAKEMNISPFHFQRLFTDWAGVSPHKFMQYLRVEHAKRLLTQESITLFETSYELGLSSTSRLHDLFVSIEGMTPAEYKNEAKGLEINYGFYESIFGELIIASTHKGVCYISFDENKMEAFEKLKSKFAQAAFKQESDEFQVSAMQFFSADWSNLKRIKLHLKGSEFQLKVWNALLSIPMGKLETYGNIAEVIDHKKAARAVGTAIGSNPVAYLIPCHRVIQQSGILGGYMWGSTRKQAIIAWESAQVYK